MTLNPNICRFCRATLGPTEGVHYGLRHHAHHACFLNAGKLLSSLTPWQVGRFPYKLLKERGLLGEAERITAAEKQREKSEGRAP